MKRNSKKHGIVRIEWNNGTEEEATFDLDKYHGLRRRIEGSQVSVELWQTDLRVFQMTFNENFTESVRMIDVNQTFTFMDEIFAYRFNKNPDEELMLRAMIESAAANNGQTN